MSMQAERIEEKESQSAASSVSQLQTNGEADFTFDNHGPESVSQMKLQELANNSVQVSQLKSYQEMADTYSKENHQAVQRKENKTGLPESLKTGMENLSGLSFIVTLSP